MGRKRHHKCTRRTHIKRRGVRGDTSGFQLPTDNIIRSLDDSFNHRYDYPRMDGSWRLPSPSKFFRQDSFAWQDAELMSMKSRLNDVKGRLSNVDIVTWQNHTQV